MKKDETQQRIRILGAGESGVGAAVLAKRNGSDVFISDNGIIKGNYKNVLLHHEINFEEGYHTEERILDADLVIKSPGIPDNTDLLSTIRETGIPVISEIEYAGRFCHATKVCITGSNGKTTTTLLTGHILRKAGINAGIAGNVGSSFAWQVATKDYDLYVLEISSFQLDGMYEFKADIAVLMNITSDHLDRYNNCLQEYTDSKFRILRNQTNRDYFIFCYDDEIIRNETGKRKTEARKLPFSIYHQLEGDGAYISPPYQKFIKEKTTESERKLVITINSKTIDMTLETLALQGKHNLYNTMAAGIASRIFDLRKESIKESLSDFQNIEHRLEHVAMIHGIEFINDSKATNVNSAWYALETVNKPVIWIAGGVDKGNDYGQLTDLVQEKVKAIVCLGLDNARIHKSFGGMVDTIVETHSAMEAVQAAYQLAEDGDVVMLSPACASFDLFNNYEDRGRKFKEAVRRL